MLNPRGGGFPQICVFQDNWADQAGKEIKGAIERVIADRVICTVMLTGGLSAQKIYQSWSSQCDFPHSKIIYFFGDERCVAFNHPDSNYGAWRQSLFPMGIPADIQIHPMRAYGKDLDAACCHYSALLPDSIDVLLLGLGEDGHIASIFPGDSVVREVKKMVVPVTGPKAPAKRLTITPKVIISANTVFLLAMGRQKGRVLSQSINNKKSEQDLPVTWASDSIWLLDESAAREIYNNIR